MDLFSVDIGYVLLLRTASDNSGDEVPPYGIALRKMGRVRLERAYSQKVWLAIRWVFCAPLRSGLYQLKRGQLFARPLWRFGTANSWLVAFRTSSYWDLDVRLPR